MRPRKTFLGRFEHIVGNFNYVLKTSSVRLFDRYAAENAGGVDIKSMLSALL